ncbi:2-methylfumaryl-CoA isomerase [Trebonia kvetii]|uniref:2-methylfumaryl-CoA isomerase n=1 Tax=Trebonia kvetii TaxID=2480626 RepID=A0A6P2BTH7_9ACTN|nr:CoA transferase [Trebonia kvetii]TVZ02280.1 2-methylfumaryl-CoA isomerase [Trebonia kvetii]
MTVRSHGLPTTGKPLTGLRVIELATFVAGPLGGMTLAQLGAEVIRVDPPGGSADYSRWPVAASGTSLYWTGLNKGKRSLVTDFRSAEGRDLITRLIAASGPGGGIVLTNADRPWLSYEALSQARPDLIHVRIDGLHDGRPAVDYTVNASTGFPLVTGPEEHAGPVNHVLPAWDVACGLYAAIAILGAERQRRLTGTGQRISVALDDVALATAGNLGFLAEAEVNGASRPKVGNHLYGSFARDFATRDGQRVMVVALTARHWTDLVAATGMRGPVSALEQALGVDFSAEQDRFAYRDSLAGLLQRWFGDRDLDQVREALAPASTLWSVYRSFRDLAESDDVRANPLMGIIDQPGIGPYHAPASPINAGMRAPVRAPLLGEDTAEILRADLGLSDDTIKELLERGVVATASPSRR